ncbi:MAG: extracellular solute-binding protein [Phycicoccus sp.]|nr:extracellular solute-binding protein [Phycicoccus sp.]
MKIRGIVAMGAIALTTISLAACSSGSGSTDASSASSTDASSAASTEQVSLTFQSLSDQPAAIAATKSIVDKWNSANPNTQVTIVSAGWDSVADKLTTQFSGKVAPDIIHYEAAGIVPFATDGYLADLTSLIDPTLKSDVPQGVWDSVTVDKKVVAVPTELQSYMVFANKSLLDAAGVTIPTGDTMTWDQFRQIAKATSQNKTYGVGWGLKSPTATFMSLGLGFGGTYFEGTGKSATMHIGTGEMAVPTQVHEMAYTDKSIDPVSLTQSGSEVLAAFYAGKEAMTVQGSYQAANMAKNAPAGFDWIVLPPLKGSVGPAQSANPQTLSVNVDSKHVKEAAEFINYFASTDNLAALNTADALIPASASAQAKIAKDTNGADGWAMVLKSGADLTRAPFLSVGAYSQWKDTVATPAYQKYLANQIDAAQLAKDLTDGWAQVSR